MKPEIFSHPELVKKFPQEVKTLFHIFGDEVRLVGGCVRDLLLKKKLNDFDFATKYLPSETTKILERNNIKAVPTGIKFGTVSAVMNGKNFEITTLRKDAETDGRHCNPQFVDDYFLDAARRDFTINALYLDAKGLVTDYFCGISDLKNHEVKFIGDANQRITEDFLRILRFFRFSCEYATKLDETGLEACVKHKESLKKLSRERIRAEILKMLASAKKNNLMQILQLLKSQGIAQEILSSEIDIKSLKSLFKIEEELKVSANLKVKLATLFCQKNCDDKILFREICATNSEKNFFQFCRKLKNEELNHGQLQELLVFESKEQLLDLYLVNLAKNFESVKISVAAQNISFLRDFLVPDFPLKSADLINSGFVGKDLGLALKKAKIIWANSDFKLKQQELLTALTGI